jgi:hypothetical protein
LLGFPEIANAQFVREGALPAESNLPVQVVARLFFRALLFIGFPHAQHHAALVSLGTDSQDAGDKASPTNQQTSRIQGTTRDGGNYRFARFPSAITWPLRKPASKNKRFKK